MNFKKKTLGTFLYEHSVFKDPTHMDMVKKRNYRIHHNESDEFLNLYINAIKWSLSHKNETPADYHLLEKTQDLGPMVVDIDIKKESKKIKSLYTEKHVTRLVKIFQKTLKKNIETKLKSTDLDCFVLEKTPYLTGKYCKNGFHLHFPYIWLTAVERYRINFLVEEAILGTKISHLKPDNTVVRSNWLLYGSSKSCESGVYKVTRIIGVKRKHIPNIFCTGELIALLSVLPRGVPGTKKFFKLKPYTETEKNEKPRVFLDYEKTPLKNLKHYISFLKDTHSEDFVSWRVVGCALFNETNGSGKGRTLWHKFSAGCEEKYSYCACEAFWNKLGIGKNNYSVGALKYFLKQSGVTDYEPKVRLLSNVKPDFDSDDDFDSEAGSGSESEPDEFLTERERYNKMTFGEY